MRIFDWGKKRRSFDSVAFDPTGEVLAAAGGYRDQETVVWDIGSGAERFRLDPFFCGLQFHPLDGRLLIPATGGVRAIDTASGAATTIPTSMIMPVGQYAVYPCFDPKTAWAVYPNEVEGQPTMLTAVARFGAVDQSTLWNVSLVDPDHERVYLSGLACLPDGHRFVSAEHIYATGPLPYHFRLALRSRTDCSLLQYLIAEDSTTHLIVFASPSSDAIIVKDRARLWVYRSDDLDALPHLIQNDGRKHFTGIAFHPSGRFLAATSNDETVKLYDTTTWEVARTFTWNLGKMRSIAFSADGTLAAAGSDSGKVVVWDVDL